MELIDREKLKASIRSMVELPNEVRAKVIGAINRAKAVAYNLSPTEPKTNADRIRSMTDEELAVSLTKTVIDAICHSHGVAEASYDVPAELLENHAEEYLKWLQQPAEE